jgi:hypothetical protein
MQAWNNRMKATEQQLQTLQARMNVLEKELARLASQVPAAQQADIVRQQQALGEAKKKMSQAVAMAASVNPSPTKSGAIRGAGGAMGSGLP